MLKQIKLEYTDNDYEFSNNPITQNAELLLFNQNINYTFGQPYLINSGFSNITIIPTEIFPKEHTINTSDSPRNVHDINTNNIQDII